MTGRTCRRGTLITAVVIVMLAASFHANAINPPNEGNFPEGFWRPLKDDPSLLEYGDPGWVRKMERRRLARLQLARRARTGVGEGGAGGVPAGDTFYLPVLLGAYSDRAGTLPVAAFQELLFGTNPTGSVTDYFNEVSYGQLNVTGTVFGWFAADQNQEFYAGNNNGFNSNFPRNRNGFVRAIVQKADPTTDFSLFDNDGPDGVPNSGDDDGYADAVAIIFAGAGADWNPGNDNLWPSMSSLGAQQYTTDDPSANGGFVRVNTNFVSPEQAGGGEGNGLIRPIGVFAHEFGHVLGLPDFYDRTDETEEPDFNRSAGIGEWCLMASGSWGGDGSHTATPAHPSAWCKIQMGWITPTVLNANVDALEVNQAETNAEAFLIWEDPFEWSRYFLLENRQQVGFDQYLNGPGLLIFHVDENRRWGRFRWSRGPVNNDETHKMLDLEEADGRADMDVPENRGDDGDPFPGSTGKRSFSGTTNPNSRDYEGLETGIEVNNISDSGPTMSMDVVVRPITGFVIAYDELGITGWGWGFDTPRTIWGGVLFTATERGVLEAVDLGFRGDVPYNYQVSVHESLTNGIAGPLLATSSGVAPLSGWYTVPVEPTTGGQIYFEPGDEFFVRLMIPNKTFALSYDRWGVRSGRSWTSSDGSTFVNNIGSQENGGDLNIRARIRRLSPACPSRLEAAELPEREVLLSWTNGNTVPESVDVFRDGELIAAAPADPPQYVDAPPVGEHDYELHFNVSGEDCPHLIATIDTTPPCDTHCNQASAELLNRTDANVRVTVDAVDVADDPINYSLEARQGLVVGASVGPQTENVFDLELEPGGWRITVTVDDGSVCFPPSPNRICETEITVPPRCNTRCRGLSVEVVTEPEVLVRATADGQDDNGDLIFYTFGVHDGENQVAEIGPQLSNVAEFELEPGDYTVSVTAADGTECAPALPDFSCEEPITVAAPPSGFLRGDCNADGMVDISDAIFSLNGLFGNDQPSPCAEACDNNGDGMGDISDPIYLLNHLFLNGPTPVDPGSSTCGPDPDPDNSLGCENPTC